MKIRQKLKSLRNRNKQFFAISYSWQEKSLIIHQTQQQYFNDLVHKRQQIGITKRAQCYVNEFITIRNQKYCIYLASYGDIRKWKFIYGENPISKEFGICMFDFVYLFLQKKVMAQVKIAIRIRELEKMEKWFLAEIMKSSMKLLFGKQIESNNQKVFQTEKQTECFKEIKNDEIQLKETLSKQQNLNDTNKL